MKRDYAAIGNDATARIQHALDRGTKDDVLAVISQLDREQLARFAEDDERWERTERIRSALYMIGCVLGPALAAFAVTAALSPLLVAALAALGMAGTAGSVLAGGLTYLVLYVLANVALFVVLDRTT